VRSLNACGLSGRLEDESHDSEKTSTQDAEPVLLADLESSSGSLRRGVSSGSRGARGLGALGGRSSGSAGRSSARGGGSGNLRIGDVDVTANVGHIAVLLSSEIVGVKRHAVSVEGGALVPRNGVLVVLEGGSTVVATAEASVVESAAIALTGLAGRSSTELATAGELTETPRISCTSSDTGIIENRLDIRLRESSVGCHSEHDGRDGGAEED